MTHPTIERLESNVRGYCRTFDATFARAEGAWQYDADGKKWLDLFAGAGVLAYGHNNPRIAKALVDYIRKGGVTHALDMTTEAKVRFLETFEKHILMPRDLPYKVMFPGPTGTNAVEAALKLARKVTGRSQVVSFTNGFHGMTLGALAVTGNQHHRGGAGVPLPHTIRAPYCDYDDAVDSLALLETLIADGSSGIEAPAAIILETVQAEGGVNVASSEWLRGVAALAEKVGALLIIDDIQVGCGRTGSFFSFESAGIRPDIVCLSKALSGYGLPLAAVLFKKEHDVWKPGEHNGTFRGFNHAFVTAAAAIEAFWADGELEEHIGELSELAAIRMTKMARRFGLNARGRGLIQGLEMKDGEAAGEVSAEAFKRGVIIETAGADGQVVKLLPPLTITQEELERGLDVVERAVETVLARRGEVVFERPKNQGEAVRSEVHA